MLYALLIYEAEEVSESYDARDQEAALSGHRALQSATKAAEAFVEANQLMPPGTATSVRVRNGVPSVTDGPFAETKELLIGLYVMNCDSLDQAIDYAARIPHAATGGVEVRPIAYLETASNEARVWSDQASP